MKGSHEAAPVQIQVPGKSCWALSVLGQGPCLQVMAWTRTELGTFKWISIYFSLVMGTDFMPPFSSPAERYLVALDQILISSEFPFSVLPALDQVSASSAHHMVLCKHFLKPFCYRTSKADVFAGMRLAGLSHIHSFKQEFLITLPIFWPVAAAPPRVLRIFQKLLLLILFLSMESPFSHRLKLSDLLVTAIGAFWLKL